MRSSETNISPLPVSNRTRRQQWNKDVFRHLREASVFILGTGDLVHNRYMANYTEDRNRCNWANGSELMARYHDEEWGVPQFDDQKLFEYLVLETMQAGLSWSTVLNKREHFRRAFLEFDFNKLSELPDEQVGVWMEDPSIIRNTAKLRAVIKNAKAFVRIQAEFGTFAKYQWSFVNGKPVDGGWLSDADLPATTELSNNFARDLKKRGFSFIGPTTCYAHMQATGMVNDHVISCWRNGNPP
jgi:DNA-3-methyladenine glycosylase I